jgi:hypothetical protein
MYSPDRVIDPPPHWTDALLGHYVLINGQPVAVESEQEIYAIVTYLRALNDDDLPALDVFDRWGHVQGEIDASGFTSMPQERDWDAVRKEVRDDA